VTKIFHNGQSSRCNTTDVTSEVGTASLPDHLSSPPVFSEVRVTRSFDLYACFVDRCLSFFNCSFDHCVPGTHHAH
jgi:hypothetical protein